MTGSFERSSGGPAASRPRQAHSAGDTLSSVLPSPDAGRTARATYDRLRLRSITGLSAEETEWLGTYRELRARQERERREKRKLSYGQLVQGWLARVRGLVGLQTTPTAATGPAERALESHARRSADALVGHWQSRHQQPALRLPRIFHATPKGVLILPGEAPGTTLAIHRQSLRPPRRMLVDMQISLPPGTIATPEAWWWMATSLSVYLGQDPLRALAAVHRGDRAQSKTRAGEPICDHMHIAWPTVQADGTSWRVPHLHAVAQGWLRTVEVVAGHHEPAVPAIRGRHQRRLAAGHGFMAVFRDDSGDRVCPLDNHLAAIAAIELPPPEQMANRWGVGHINATIGNARRGRLQRAAQRAWAKAADTLSAIVASTLAAGRALGDYITGCSHPRYAQAVERLRVADPERRMAEEMRRYFIGK